MRVEGQTQIRGKLKFQKMRGILEMSEESRRPDPCNEKTRISVRDML
jgi:hypothetical protein